MQFSFDLQLCVGFIFLEIARLSVTLGFLGGASGWSDLAAAAAAVKNPPCNAQNMGLISDQETKVPHASEQLSRSPKIRESEHHNYRWMFVT